MIRIALICMLAVGCGATAQQTTLKASATAIDAARAGWFAYDKSHQKQIVDQQVALVKAGTIARADGDTEAKLELTAWYPTQAKVLALIDGAYRAGMLYAATKDDPTALANLKTALKLVQDELAQIGAAK